MPSKWGGRLGLQLFFIHDCFRCGCFRRIGDDWCPGREREREREGLRRGSKELHVRCGSLFLWASWSCMVSPLVLPVSCEMCMAHLILFFETFAKAPWMKAQLVLLCNFVVSFHVVVSTATFLSDCVCRMFMALLLASSVCLLPRLLIDVFALQQCLCNLLLLSGWSRWRPGWWASSSMFGTGLSG